MTEYVVVTVPGIGEPESLDGNPVGLLGGLCALLPTRFTCKQFNWRNAFGPVPVWNGSAYEVNLEDAEDGLFAFVQAQTKPVILAGYSGGADLVSRVAARAPGNLAGVVAVANPRRGREDSTEPFWGIVEEHLPFSVPLLDIANRADVIPCCPPNSPLRDFYDLVAVFSVSDPQQWGRDVLRKAQLGLLTNSVRLSRPTDWWLAFCYARGYVWDGQHTTYYAQRLPEYAAAIDAKWS